MDPKPCDECEGIHPRNECPVDRLAGLQALLRQDRIGDLEAMAIEQEIERLGEMLPAVEEGR